MEVEARQLEQKASDILVANAASASNVVAAAAAASAGARAKRAVPLHLPVADSSNTAKVGACISATHIVLGMPPLARTLINAR